VAYDCRDSVFRSLVSISLLEYFVSFGLIMSFKESPTKRFRICSRLG
jgi:hypothetical protein